MILHKINAHLIKVFLLSLGFFCFQAYAEQLKKSDLSGGRGTVKDNTSQAFSRPAKNITKPHRDEFFIGKALFNDNWVTAPSSVTSRHGLGPLFNAKSCSACHAGGGRGNPSEPFVGLLFRLSLKNQKGPHNEPVGLPGYGDQFQPNAILGVPPEGEVNVRYTEVQGNYPDGSSYSLRKPEYSFKNLNYEPFPTDVLISPRLAPQLIGVGLLESISEEDIVKNGQINSKEFESVHGKPNRIWDVQNKTFRIGRFGLKANQPSVAQQIAGAFSGDMGITSPLFPKENCQASQKKCLLAFQNKSTDISEENFKHIVTWAKLLAVPARRNSQDPQVQMGETVFIKAQCHSCHTPSHTTSENAEFSENSKQTIYPYTDLLLHNMGDQLADGRPDFEASENEWRTPPLWGIGLIQKVNKQPFFLHDGRARTLEEAILWHAGEAENSIKIFTHLPLDERNALLSFLNSL